MKPGETVKGSGGEWGGGVGVVTPENGPKLKKQDKAQTNQTKAEQSSQE